MLQMMRQRVFLKKLKIFVCELLGNSITEMRAFSRSKSLKFHIIYIEGKQTLGKEAD